MGTLGTWPAAVEPNQESRASQGLTPAAINDRERPDFVQLKPDESRFIHVTVAAAPASEGDSWSSRARLVIAAQFKEHWLADNEKLDHAWVQEPPGKDRGEVRRNSLETTSEQAGPEGARAVHQVVHDAR